MTVLKRGPEIAARNSFEMGSSWEWGQVSDEGLWAAGLLGSGLRVRIRERQRTGSRLLTRSPGPSSLRHSVLSRTGVCC
jgi:hypothetical protein